MYSPNIEGFSFFIYKFISQQTLYKPDINALMPNKYIYWALERLYQAYKEFAVK